MESSNADNTISDEEPNLSCFPEFISSDDIEIEEAATQEPVADNDVPSLHVPKDPLLESVIDDQEVLDLPDADKELLDFYEIPQAPYIEIERPKPKGQKATRKKKSYKSKINLEDVRNNPLMTSSRNLTDNRSKIRSASRTRVYSKPRLFETVSFNVNANIKINAQGVPKILAFSCGPSNPLPPSNGQSLNSDSYSSGNLADISQSSTSSPTTSHIQLPPGWANRASGISNSSSGSSVPASAAVLNKQLLEKQLVFNQCRYLNSERMEELLRRWYKPEMIFHILDYIDRSIFEQQEKNNNAPNVPSARKRRMPNDNNGPVRKRRNKLNMEYLDSLIGKQIFAKCQDNLYHYGIVTDITPIGKLDIDFADAKYLCVDVKDTILDVSSILHQQALLATDNESTYQPVIVTSFATKTYPCKVNVISDYGDFVVGAGKILLTKAQVLTIRQAVTPTEQANAAAALLEIGKDIMSTRDNNIDLLKENNNIDLPGNLNKIDVTIDDNINIIDLAHDDINIDLPIDASNAALSYDDVSPPNMNFVDIDINLPGPSGLQKLPSSETLSSDSDAPYPPDPDDWKLVSGCDPEAATYGLINSLLKLKGAAGKIPKRRNKEEDRVLGPLDFKSNWFKDVNFILTCSVRNLLVWSEKNKQSDSDSNNTESEDFVFSNVPYVSDRLIQQIQYSGGRVIRNFDEFVSTMGPHTYLITNRPCLSVSFIKCLALGIKVACHEWIINCASQGKRLRSQELPAGYSIETNSFITMYQRKFPRPFNGLQIHIAHYSDHKFTPYWEDICKIMGATTCTNSRVDRSSMVVVVESGYRGILVEEAKEMGIPVVSTVWVVQSLIHGERRAFDGHPQYNHLYDEEWHF